MSTVTSTVTDLVLVRHGEAVSNVEPVIAGLRSDRGLTERGHRQAARLEERLRAERPAVDVLYVSTLRRALETGAYVARALQLTPYETADLHELRPGDADGLTIDQWRARADREVPPSDPYLPFSPGGESWATFLLRAQTTLRDLVARHPGRTVWAVCHGGILEASFSLAFERGASAPRLGVEPQNTSLTHWRHDSGARAGRSPWTLVSFGDAAHLTGELASDSPHDSVPTSADEG